MRRTMGIWYGFSLVVVIAFLIQSTTPFFLSDFNVSLSLWIAVQAGLAVVVGLAWFRCWRNLPDQPDVERPSGATEPARDPQPVDDLIGPLVHEINRPLSRLDQRLNRIDDLPTEANRDLQTLRSTVDLIRRIFEDEPRSRWLNVVRLVRTLAGRFRTSRGLRFAVGTDWIYADPDGLELALKNLIQNSLQARESVDQVVEVFLNREGPETVITVHDQSGGMAREQAERLSSGGRLRRSDGMGLGFYITRRIVEAHRGRCSVRTRPDEGTTVTLILPRPGGSESTRTVPGQPREDSS